MLLRPLSIPRVTQAAAALSAVIVLLMLAQHAQHREHLPRLPFEIQTARLLEEEGAPNVMLLAGPADFAVQARTGHPVFVETATASLVSYLPELGPSIQRMYAEVYGIRFTVPPQENPDWMRLWRERPAADWQTLGARYGFGYVVAEAGSLPALECVLEGDGYGLYVVPAMGT